MNNKEIVKQLTKLQILTIRWIERHTNLKCSSYRSMEQVLTANKLTCTYLDAINNLKSNIEEYCNSDYLKSEVLNLENIIKQSNIKDLRFGFEPQKKFTEEEKSLDEFKIQCTLYMVNEMVDIKYASQELGINESVIKQACQHDKLLNTRKIDESWMVHIPECRAYWNIPDTDNKHLYKDWVY